MEQRLDDLLSQVIEVQNERNELRKQLDAALARPEWSVADEAARRILRQAVPNIELPPEGMLHHAANVGLAQDWEVVAESAAWKDLEDALRRLDQALVQQVFDKALEVNEAEPAKKVIETVLGLPFAARQVGQQSQEFLNEIPGEGMEEVR